MSQFLSIPQIDNLVRPTLVDFTAWVFDNKWVGKEREAVNLYAMGYLLKKCEEGTPFHDPTQVAIEVLIRQPDGFGSKHSAARDLVIWRRPRQNAWARNKKGSFPQLIAETHPISILEWKVGRPAVDEKDIRWLKGYANERKKFVGYAITLDLDRRKFRLACGRIDSKGVDREWLVIQ